MWVDCFLGPFSATSAPMQPLIREILASVDRPFRYVGGEVASRPQDWDRVSVRMCLAFPEVYEMGMSHLGLSILYHIINDRPDFLAERAFAPWTDMEEVLHKHNARLFSLESHRPLADFDLLGFSLSHELTYTNVLNMLGLSNIPWRADDRNGDHPIVIAGGPCTFNPEPVAPFFDAIVIGDGEEIILKIAEVVGRAKRTAANRRQILNELKEIQGVYVPSLGNCSNVGRAVVADINDVPFPIIPVVPHASTQDRLAIEVARGCARGCRFCQAGYIYRPVRQRGGALASDLAVKGLKIRGDERFSFLSLSIGDWSPLEDALSSVHLGCGGMTVNANLPSLRTEALTGPVIDALGRARFGSFTLAPEAGSERMRRFINKGNTNQDLYTSVQKVFESGWHAIKLYFMLGLPGETEEDLEGIVEIANRCRDIGRQHHRRPEVTVSTSTFVPKAHTPFQWERQISIDEVHARQQYLKKRLRGPGLSYRWHDAGKSFLEGVFSRGGQELAPVIEKAYEKGARFDAWEERFDLSRWLSAFDEVGIDPKEYLNERDRDAAFPWDHLGVGPDRDFLWRERERARELAATPDCTTGPCSHCGICDFQQVKNRLAVPLQSFPRKRESRGSQGSPAPRSVSGTSFAGMTKGGAQDDNKGRSQDQTCRYRIRYHKKGRAAFLGHQETSGALRRAVRAAGLPLIYSQGFHPRVRISFGPALPVGMESEAEFADVWLYKSVDSKKVVKRLNDHLPEGMRVIAAGPLSKVTPSIEEDIASMTYQIHLQSSAIDIKDGVRRFDAAQRVMFTRVRPEGQQVVDLKEAVGRLAVIGHDVIEVACLNRPPRPRVGELLQGVFGLSQDSARALCVRKTAVEWKS